MGAPRRAPTGGHINRGTGWGAEARAPGWTGQANSGPNWVRVIPSSREKKLRQHGAHSDVILTVDVSLVANAVCHQCTEVAACEGLLAFLD